MPALSDHRGADVVVIGAGAYGASLTFHLASMGVKVILLDQHDAASQTSPRAAGLTSELHSREDMTRISQLSIEKFLRFEDETGEKLDVNQPGSIWLAFSRETASNLGTQIEAAKRWGVRMTEIGLDEVKELAPAIETDAVASAAYVPADLYIDPPELLHGYLTAAQRLGAIVLSRKRVTAVGLTDGKVTGVTTPDGEIRADWVIDTAGAWSGLISSLVGLELPLVPVRHQLLITQPIPGLAPDHAICRFRDQKVYVRPCDGGLMLGGYEPRPMPVDPQQLSSLSIDSLELEIEVLEDLAVSVSSHLPIIQSSPVREHRGGLPTMTPDNRPLLGPVSGIRGFLVASGCCVGGLSTSPAIGQLLAELVVEGHPSIPIGDLAVNRFKGKFETVEQLRSACVAAYGSQYIPPNSSDRSRGNWETSAADHIE